MTLPGALPELTPGSLDWWLRRLGARLNERHRRMTSYDDYYNGRQRLAFASDKFLRYFGDRFPAFSSNFMSLVVDSHRERLSVQGFRVGSAPEGDEDLQRWWQTNHLDAGSQILHQESLVSGVAYISLWLDGEGDVQASIESPLQVVVETDPGRPWQRLAGLKRYLGDDLHLHAELYLPDGIYKFRSVQRDNAFSSPTWFADLPTTDWVRERPADEDWPIPNPTGLVPIIPFVNRPRLGLGTRQHEYRDGQSELAMVMSNQDAINKLRADALVSSEFAAFRQRWAIGIDIPTDPLTGEPIEDFRAAVDHLWTIPPPDPNDPNPPQVQFGEFEATDLAPYYAGINLEVQHIGSITRTPYHYLLPQAGQPPSGDSLKSSETGLVAKVRDSMLHKGESWEEVARMRFLFLGDARADQPLETIWKDPEYRSEAEHVDALLKLKALGVADELLLEMIPLTPQQIARNRRALARAALLAPPPPAPVLQIGAPSLALRTSTTPDGIAEPVQ